MRYLFLASLAYDFPIMRPLQEAIRRAGGEAAWFFDRESVRKFLKEDEIELRSVREVMKYNPVAVFATGGVMYDFFPGVKVELFHGFNIDKRPGRGDHFDMRGWFDLYCVNDISASEKFRELADKYGSFKSYDTGWSKVDGFFEKDGTIPLPKNDKPVILYCSTFTKWITSTPYLYDEIERLIRERDWEWLITFHPLMARETVEKYKALQERYPNVRFVETDNNIELLKQADVMLCDSSSIIFEFMYFLKPVVTFRNTASGDHLVDILEPELLEQSLEYAISRPQELMRRVKAKIDSMHPYRDGKSSERILNAVDSFIENYQGKLKPKRISLDRRWKARRRVGYYPFLGRLSGEGVKKK